MTPGEVPAVRDGDTGTITLRWELKGGYAWIYLPRDLPDGPVTRGTYQDEPAVCTVAVDPRLPDHWPPQAGEVWIDSAGGHWVTIGRPAPLLVNTEDTTAIGIAASRIDPEGWRRVYPAEET